MVHGLSIVCKSAAQESSSPNHSEVASHLDDTSLVVVVDLVRFYLRFWELVHL